MAEGRLDDPESSYYGFRTAHRRKGMIEYGTSMSTWLKTPFVC